MAPTLSPSRPQLRPTAPGLLAQLPDGLLVVGPDARILYANPAAEELLAAPPGELPGRLFGHPVRPGETLEIDVSGGRRRELAEARCAAAKWEGQPCHLVSLRPVQERRRLKESLQKSSEMLRALVAGAPVAIAAIDLGGRVMLWNNAAMAILGWSDVEVLGNPLPATAPDEAECLAAIARRAMAGESFVGRELPGQQRQDGFRVDLQVWTARLADSGGLPSGIIIMLADVTERRRVEAHIRRLVGHDALTGLPNRKQFRKQLQRTLGRHALRRDVPIMALQLGIDRFKSINKSLGHGGGDRLLQAVTRRLSGSLYETDLLARTGGDEFSILLRDTHNIPDGARVAQKLLQQFAAPFDIEGEEVFVTVSVGIAVHPHDGDKAEELIHAADSAMDRAKEQGGNAWQFFTPELDARAQRQLTLEWGLRHALERGEMHLHYQPQFDLAGGRLVGVEALLRWQHPQLGNVSPAQFIPVAESSGLIVPIGAWVLRTACLQASRWEAEGLPPLRLAVNISARQFLGGTVREQVAAALADSGLAPQRLELELTESLWVQEVGGAAETLRALKGLGVRLAIDDFGTGYSNLAYLAALPVDTLKIDQSFVRQMEEDPRNGTIAKAITDLAHALGHRVLAEGVETAAQLAFLREQGCDEAQGYFLGKPMPPREIGRLLAEAMAGAIDDKN